jgi:methyl-accepting chemotaxis protein
MDGIGLMAGWTKVLAHIGAWRCQGNSPMGLLLPLGGIIAVALVSCAVVIASLVMTVNERAADYMKSVISSALAHQMEDIGDIAQAVAREAGTGIYAGDVLKRELAHPHPHGVFYSYLIDSGGRTHLLLGSDGKPAPDPWQASPTGMHVLMRGLPRTIASAREMRSSLVLISRHEGKPAIMAAMPILSANPRAGESAAGLHYVLLVQKLDASILSHWNSTIQLPSLGWTDSEIGDGFNSVTLTDAGSGEKIGSIIWPAHQVGKKSLGKIMPLLLVCGIVFGVLTFWLILQIHRSRTAQEESNRVAITLSAEANENAARADRARREAEAALAEAEAARQRADEMARREVAEQASHREQLRENSRRMATALQESMASLVKQLLETANDLELSAETTIGALQEQQKQADVVRGRSRDAVAEIQAVTGGIEELTASIAEIRKAADESRQFALEASDRSSAARGANDHLLHQVVSIGDAASLIASIAKQTNLLALNAAIEAARAGASGYGFAVVANEVKALASETARTTGSIHDRVGGIETAARSTVELVGSLDEMLGGLVQAMAASSATVQQQQAVAENIRRSSRGVADNARVADQAVEAISRSLESIAQTASSTRHIGAAVRNRAEHLNSEFARLVAQLEAA